MDLTIDNTIVQPEKKRPPSSSLLSPAESALMAITDSSSLQKNSHYYLSHCVFSTTVSTQIEC